MPDIFYEIFAEIYMRSRTKNKNLGGGGSTLVRIESPRLRIQLPMFFFVERALNAEKPAFCSFKSQLGLFKLT